MRAAVVSGGSCAIGFSSTLQWFRRRFHYISGAVVVCAAMLGSGAFQPCHASTASHFTAPFDLSMCGSIPPQLICVPGHVPVSIVVNSDLATTNSSQTRSSVTLSVPGGSFDVMDRGSANTGSVVAWVINNGSVIHWQFAFNNCPPYADNNNPCYNIGTEGDIIGDSSSYAVFYQKRTCIPNCQSPLSYVYEQGRASKSTSTASSPPLWTAVSGAPTFSVQKRVLRPASGNDGIVALATATDATGLSITLGQAAHALGFDHFNWIQKIMKDPDLKSQGPPNSKSCEGKSYPTGSMCDRFTNIFGNVPALGTVDPPKGGWRYQITWAGRNNMFPGADFNPFYFDEYFPSKNARVALDYKAAQLIAKTLPDAPECKLHQLNTCLAN